MKIVAVIPARMDSSRFPGKPLATLRGRPMIEHVFRRTAMCERLDAVYIATCDDEIRIAAEGFGCNVLMTSAAHERASDRVAEAAERIIEADIVVMIQGDEPLITPEMIDAALAPLLQDPSVMCVNLARRIESREEFLDPNTIKVVTDVRGDAIYFSRAPIPAINVESFGRTKMLKQVCVIPFRRDFLREFSRLAPTPLERAESIDMLRLIEHGGRVRIVETVEETHAVDTPEDLRLVETMMKHDPLGPRDGHLFTRGETRA
ncbi:MAG: 3-deoxy-manno-octulosonate cytidylyltransferase synthetase [Acidobacteriota bacterium]|nr:3-deoxy-manno-octulosonate cytidylyltransferase synthetase [Acidobacteriota bacterium]